MCDKDLNLETNQAEMYCIHHHIKASFGVELSVRYN